jgi:hypothetical protein
MTVGWDAGEAWRLIDRVSNDWDLRTTVGPGVTAKAESAPSFPLGDQEPERRAKLTTLRHFLRSPPPRIRVERQEVSQNDRWRWRCRQYGLSALEPLLDACRGRGNACDPILPVGRGRPADWLRASQGEASPSMPLVWRPVRFHGVTVVGSVLREGSSDGRASILLSCFQAKVFGLMRWIRCIGMQNSC